MNSFRAATRVEKQGLKEIEPFLHDISDDGTVPIYMEDRDFQETCGDLIIDIDGIARFVEGKFEQTYTGNLFLETWSNYRKKQGWLYSCHSDFLLYYFLGTNELYVMRMKALQLWASDWVRFRQYRQKPQSKYPQPNDTRGRIVPIDDLEHDLDNDFMRIPLKSPLLLRKCLEKTT